MKLKKVVWEWSEYSNQYEAIMFATGYSQIFEHFIIFKLGDCWLLHSGNRDPSEHMHTSESLEELFDFAQAFQDKNVMREFFEEEDK